MGCALILSGKTGVNSEYAAALPGGRESPLLPGLVTLPYEEEDGSTEGGTCQTTIAAANPARRLSLASFPNRGGQVCENSNGKCGTGAEDEGVSE